MAVRRCEEAVAEELEEIAARKPLELVLENFEGKKETARKRRENRRK